MNPHVYLSDKKQIAAVESLKRVDDEGYLYHMDCSYDYYSIPEAFQKVVDAGCSTFVSRNLEGEILFCRNYDYSHYLNNDKSNPRTGINVIVEGNNPKAKYRSLGVADVYWLDFKNGTYAQGAADDGKSDLSPFIVTPFICMEASMKRAWQSLSWHYASEVTGSRSTLILIRRNSTKTRKTSSWTRKGKFPIRTG